HKAVLLNDGRILFVGGVGTGWTFLSSAEIYDPAANRFLTTGSMHVARESHSVIGLSDGSVIVLGGHVGRGTSMRLYDQIERFDPKTETFKAAGSMKIARHKQDATLLPDGTIFISGGADTRDFDGVYASTEIYDPRSETSTMSNPMRIGRYKHEGNSIWMPGNDILFAGGASQAERLDLTTGKTYLIPGETDLAGQFSASTKLPDGRVLITGGYGGGTGPRASAWVYSPMN
ncbi:hypothetical protein HQ496_14110, partial [bacterium]|nr:hypothetical protein [bacterium]